MPLLDINSWNSFEVNWAPLSLTTVFGIPNLANTVRNFLMVRAEVVVSVMKISGHFVEASAITNRIFFRDRWALQNQRVGVPTAFGE